MKRKCRYIRIAAYEIYRNLRIIAFNIVIGILLFSIILPMLELADDIPTKFYQEMEDSGLDNIEIGNVIFDDFEYLFELPIKMKHYYSGISFFDMNTDLEDEQVENLAKSEIDAEVGINQWMDKDRSIDIKKINDGIVEGNTWTEGNNQELSDIPMWISDRAAEILNLSVNETFHILDSENKEIGKIKIEGIYKQDEELSEFYLPADAFETYFNNENSRYTILTAPVETKDFMKIVDKLKKQYFIVVIQDEEVRSVQLLVYMLYVMCIILLLTFIGIIENLLSVYFEKRKSLFGVYLAIGMNESDLLKIHLVIAETILAISMLVSILLSKKIFSYMIDYIADLFEYTDMNRSLSIKPVVIIILIMNFMLIFVLHKIRKKIKNLCIVDIISEK